MTDFGELQTLIRKSRNGDRASQKIFYMRFHAFGLKICLRYAENRNLAVELLNESIYIFFTKPDRPDPVVSVEDHLRKIIIACIIGHYRQSKNPAYTDAVLYMPEYGTDPVTSEQQNTIRMLSRLPELDRIIFNMHVVERYSLEEIASQLNQTHEETCVRLAAARASLKSLIR